MDSFFDTNVVIDYASYNQFSKNPILLNSYKYITNPSGDFYLCARVLKEINKISKKLAFIQIEVLKKLRDKNYKFSARNELLNEKDIVKIKKLYLMKSSQKYEIVLNEFEESKRLLLLRINFLIERKIKQIVIPESEIDKTLVSNIRKFINNYTDCEILASALIFQKGRDLFLFVTADKDFDPNGYAYISSDPNFSEWKFPKLKNMLY
jgi:hypothetical protein